MATAVMAGTPVVMVVVNNQGWLAIKDLQMDAYGKSRTMAVDFVTPEGDAYNLAIASAAKAFGWHAQKVDSRAAIGPAVKKALKAGKPALVEVTVHRDYPYSGSPAVGWWDVPVPAYLKERRARYEKESAEEKL
jgi:acetolactate synthase-1/2/3 large subunit